MVISFHIFAALRRRISQFSVRVLQSFVDNYCAWLRHRLRHSACRSGGTGDVTRTDEAMTMEAMTTEAMEAAMATRARDEAAMTVRMTPDGATTPKMTTEKEILVTNSYPIENSGNVTIKKRNLATI